ncbi:MAG: hypothetical protein ACRDYC_10310, partial [Acidimicrobiales bacterium]
GGLLVTPTGVVSFSDTHGGTTTVVGAGPINSPCLLNVSGLQCVATLTTTLPPGTNVISASWAGDLLGAGSTSTNVTVAVP